MEDYPSDAAKRHKCLVVDDERHAIELLSDYIAAIPQLQLVNAYQDPVAALMGSAGERYDFIFLDIDMPRLSGLELSRNLRPVTEFLVFTTAHQKYAFDAFEMQADHYLLKPISMGKFALTVDQLLKGKSISPTLTDAPDNTFFIKSDQKGKFLRLSKEDIIAVEGLKNYVKLYTHSQRHITYLSMKEAESALCHSGNFIRVHKSFIVAKNQIEMVNGRMIKLKDGPEVPIGDSYRQGFYDYIARNTLMTSRS